MLSEWNFGLKQKFNIKCIIDDVVFVIACLLFLFFAKINGVSPYDTFVFLAVIIALNATVHFITKQWILRTIKKTMTVQSDSLTETTNEIMDVINSQKRIFETLSTNTKNISMLIEKLKSLSEKLLHPEDKAIIFQNKIPVSSVNTLNEFADKKGIIVMAI